jgi:hypothetical protein
MTQNAGASPVFQGCNTGLIAATIWLANHAPDRHKSSFDPELVHCGCFQHLARGDCESG